jgi:hypothetical protein
MWRLSRKGRRGGGDRRGMMQLCEALRTERWEGFSKKN